MICVNYQDLWERFSKIDVAAIKKTLLFEVPEMKCLLDEAQNNWKMDICRHFFAFWDDGVLYGLGKLLDNEVANREVIQRTFNVIEILMHEDELIKDVAGGATFDWLWKRKNLITSVEPFMGPQTKREWSIYLDTEKAFALWQLSQISDAE